MPTHNYSIIIPAYNEGERIPTSLEKVLSYVTRNFPGRAEIIVVNDGSTDGTADIVREYARRNRAVRLIENPENRGKGYSVRNGMLHASGDILLFSDADLSAPIGESERLFAALHAGADIAIGSRWIDPGLQIEHQPALREVLGRIFNLLLRIILRLHFKDTQCGFKAFTRRWMARRCFWTCCGCVGTTSKEFIPWGCRRQRPLLRPRPPCAAVQPLQAKQTLPYGRAKATRLVTFGYTHNREAADYQCR